MNITTIKNAIVRAYNAVADYYFYDLRNPAHLDTDEHEDDEVTPAQVPPMNGLDKRMHVEDVAIWADVEPDDVLDLLDRLGHSTGRDGLVEPVMARVAIAMLITRAEQMAP